MVIEFAGVSGSGKTTAIAGLTRDPETTGVVIPKGLYDKRHGYLNRNVKKIIRFVSDIFERPGDWKVCRSIFSFAPDIRGYQRVKLLINFTAFNREQKAYRDPQTVYLIDEGAFQQIWSFFLRTKTKPNAEIIRLFFSLFESPDKLVIVEADTETVVSRLEKRNSHEYIQRSMDLKERVKEMKGTMRDIVELSVQGGYIARENIVILDSTEGNPVTLSSLFEKR